MTPLLLHYHRQVHTDMDAAIVMEGTGCVERANSLSLTRRVEHHKIL